jgi:hypothetical protein
MDVEIEIEPRLRLNPNSELISQPFDAQVIHMDNDDLNTTNLIEIESTFGFYKIHLNETTLSTSKICLIFTLFIF